MFHSSKSAVMKPVDVVMLTTVKAESRSASAVPMRVSDAMSDRVTIAVATTRMTRYARSSGSCGRSESAPRSARQYSAKLTPPRIMKTIATSSIASESNAAIDAVRVEKPPVAIVVRMWLIASNGPMPAAMNATKPAAVNAT